MKTTHLRIGSIVEYLTEEGWSETKLDSEDLTTYTDEKGNFTEHRPVPITPERLLKNGFIKVYNKENFESYAYQADNFSLVLRGKIGLYIPTSGNSDSLRKADIVRMNPIESLHELQNLMMVLFDKEII
jgi:hypothetical protein